VSAIDRPVPHWHDFMPLAHAEVAKFLKTQDIGKFQKDDLLGVATIALATAKPSDKWARKAIKGALFDYVRTRDKIVSDHEQTEDEYLAKTAELDNCLPTARTAKPKPCAIPSDNPIVDEWRKRHHVTVGPPPRRVRRRMRHPTTGKWLELLPSRVATSTGYKVSSKHNKVTTAPVPCAHQDGWEPTLGGMKRAKIEDDEHQEHAPGSGLRSSAAKSSSPTTLERASSSGSARRATTTARIISLAWSQSANGRRRESRPFFETAK
jgi:hypothetical protein